MLDRLPYGYNSGVSLYHCGRCQGLWLPLREMVQLMQSLKLGQSIAADVRGLIAEMNRSDRELTAFYNFVQFWRRLTT